MTAHVLHGDATALPLRANSIDAIVCDPPYELAFMAKDWDSAGVAFDPQTWAEAFRVLKPGGHLLAFGGSRTWHRLACVIEDAGFELRDSIAWMYGSGFPKSLDVSKAIDKAARGVPQGTADPTSPHHGKYRTQRTEGKRWDGDSGRGYGAGGSRFLADGAESGSGTERAASGVVETAPDARQWQGWGTALKPAHEPIVVARKPLSGTVAANVQQWGTGAINIDGCRVEGVPPSVPRGQFAGSNNNWEMAGRNGTMSEPHTAGRWPSNVVLSHGDCDEVCEPGCPVAMLDQQSGNRPGFSSQRDLRKTEGARHGIYGRGLGDVEAGERQGYGDSGGASRFFPTFRYQAKAPARERPVGPDGTKHPTTKPLDLMRWLVRLVTPPGGIVLDPFAGSGTTLEAAQLEGFDSIGVEKHAPYLPLIEQRIERSVLEPLVEPEPEPIMPPLPPPPAVPACGIVDCTDSRKTHKHDGWVAGIRVVVEPKRPSAPGWAWSSPHGTITSPLPYGQGAREVVDVDFGDRTRQVPLDLLTRYHSHRRRKPPEQKPKLLPRLPRSHVLSDPDIEQPNLFEAS